MGSRIDEPLTMTRSSTTYYYNTDGLGSVRQVLNSSGTIVESYDYDPYGQTTIYNSSLTDITSSGSGIDNPYMFTGRRFDEETGIYHYRARQYDPAIGRFLQRDPLGYYDSMNLFEYVGSNPVNWIDPYGLKITDILENAWEFISNPDQGPFQTAGGIFGGAAGGYAGLHGGYLMGTAIGWGIFGNPISGAFYVGIPLAGLGGWWLGGKGAAWGSALGEAIDDALGLTPEELCPGGVCADEPLENYMCLPGEACTDPDDLSGVQCSANQE